MDKSPDVDKPLMVKAPMVTAPVGKAPIFTAPLGKAPMVTAPEGKAPLWTNHLWSKHVKPRWGSLVIFFTSHLILGYALFYLVYSST